MRKRVARVLSCLLVGVLLLAGGVSAFAATAQVTVTQEIVVDGAATGVVVGSSEWGTDVAVSAEELNRWKVALAEEAEAFPDYYFWGLYYDTDATQPVKEGDFFPRDTIVYRVWDEEEPTTDPNDTPESGPQIPEGPEVPIPPEDPVVPDEPDVAPEEPAEPTVPEEDADVPDIAPVPELG